MKYVLLFVGTMEDQKQFESQSTEEMQKAMGGAMNWFESYTRAGKVVGGEQLKGPETVTTVRFKDGKPKEIIGGFAVVDVKDLDEALDMAKAWPAGPVEVWPAVER